jgi:hypothetical protein
MYFLKPHGKHIEVFKHTFMKTFTLERTSGKKKKVQHLQTPLQNGRIAILNLLGKRDRKSERLFFDAHPHTYKIAIMNDF